MHTTIAYNTVQIMPRPTTLKHPLADLRRLAGLGRQQLASHLGVSRVTVEKWERGERAFPALQRQNVFRETGVCPGWLADPQAPIHTADGHPYTRAEFDRWNAWRDGRASAPDGPLPAGLTGVGGRRLGPDYRHDCCPGPGELLGEGPVAALSPREVGAWQRRMAQERLRHLHGALMDRVRGVGACLRKPEDEDRLLKLMARVREIFPEAEPLPDAETRQIMANWQAGGR